MITPFEKENLIFIDTEFTTLEPNEGEILSIGIVKLDGSELYLELETSAEPSDWVKKHILPSLKHDKVSPKIAADKISEFLEGREPFAIAFVDNYDVIYITKLYGAGKLPFKWLTIDLASILFGMGVNPVRYLANESGAISFYKKLGINVKKYRQHHALDDARLVRDVWLKLVK